MARKTTAFDMINGIKYYYEYVYEIENDIKKYKKIRAKSIAELKRKVKEHNKKLEQGYDSSQDTLFKNFFHNWLHEVKFLKLKESSKEVYERIERLYILTAPFANKKVSELSLNHIQKFYNSCGLSDSLLLQIDKLIKPCLKHAYKLGLINKDISTLLEVNKKTIHKKEVEILSKEDQQKLINSLGEGFYDDLFLVALSTGLRIGEITALEWSDFDEEAGTLSINKTFRYVKNFDTGQYDVSITTPKTRNSNRVIKLAPKTIEILKCHREKQNLLISKLGETALYPDLIFSNNRGNYIAPQHLRNNFNAALEKAKIKKVKFHALRHTFATRLFEARVPVKTVSMILGHRDTSITESVYLHVLDNLKDEVASIINDVL